MGMYTELYFNSALKEDTPQGVINVLKFMVNNDEPMPILPPHSLFTDTRWGFMLRCDSYYFDADTHSTVRFDEIGNQYYLCIQTNLKNYDNEIEKFLDWIAPYLDKRPGDFLGFKRYEEDNDPSLIYHGYSNE